jgi:hypothetical protein
MRFRITVRGDGTELRGYMDASVDGLADFAHQMDGFGIVVASPAEDDYDPFAISQPEFPPTPEASIEVIAGFFNLIDDQGGDEDQLVGLLAGLHFQQANVIRGERFQREQAEAELRDRELHHFEVEQMSENYLNGLRRAEELNRGLVAQIEDIKAIRSNFPEKCEVHDEDDITCGWKSMIAGIDKVLADD